MSFLRPTATAELNRVLAVFERDRAAYKYVKKTVNIQFSGTKNGTKLGEGAEKK